MYFDVGSRWYGHCTVSSSREPTKELELSGCDITLKGGKRQLSGRQTQSESQSCLLIARSPLWASTTCKQSTHRCNWIKRCSTSQTHSRRFLFFPWPSALHLIRFLKPTTLVESEKFPASHSAKAVCSTLMTTALVPSFTTTQIILSITAISKCTKSDVNN